MTFQDRRVSVRLGLAAGAWQQSRYASAYLNGLCLGKHWCRSCMTFNNGVGNGGSTDAVNDPVQSQLPSSGATPTIYIYAIVP